MRNVRVFVSSPGDLKAERQIIASLIDSFNNRATLRDNYKFTPYLYERFAPAMSGELPQDVVNDQMLRPSDTDVMIVMLWSRFGTPLAQINPDTGQVYGSGTEYEFYDAYRAYQSRKSPVVLLYRCTRPLPDNADPVQSTSVTAFFRRFEGNQASLKGLYKTFDTPDALSAQITNDLETIIARWERPTQKFTDQLRSAWPVLALLVVTIAALIALVLRGGTPAITTPTATPFTLAGGKFNVALAPFTVDADKFTAEEKAQIDEAKLPDTLTTAFTSDLKAKLADISLSSPLTLWTPDKVAQISTTPITDDLSAAALNVAIQKRFSLQADVIIYAVISKDSNGKRVVQPGFYVTDKQPDLLEVKGRFDLDSLVSAGSITGDTALKLGMTSRAQLIAYVAYGLSLMATQQYQTAINDSFTPVLSAIEANQPKAAVVINVLKGSAAFSTYNALAAVSSPREQAAQDALNTAEASFKAAYDLNPDYSRALLGLASAKFVRLTNADDPSLNTLLSAFSDILADYDKAANAKDQPPSAEILTKVAFGKGQVYRLMYALTLNDDAYQAGNDSLTKVIDAGKVNTSPQLREIVARAYALRGGLIASKAGFDANADGYNNAIKDYSAAEKLSEVSASQALYHRQGIRAQFDQAVLRGDALKIESAFSQFAALIDPAPPAAELAGMWQIKGHYYANNGRYADAISAYTSALKLDLTKNNQLAASLWFDLGNANDAQCYVESAVSAFTQTIALDGKNPNYRRLPALIRRYTRQSCF